VTAINAAAPRTLPVASANSNNHLNPVFPFRKFFSSAPELPAPPKKKVDDKTNSAAVAFIPAAPKLLQPVTLSMVEPQLATPLVPEQPADSKLEKLDVPQQENSPLPGPGELAFAAKLVQDVPRQTTAQGVSNPQLMAPSTPPTQQPSPRPGQDSNTVKRAEPAPPTLERRAGPSQHGSDAPPAGAAPPARAQIDIVAAHTQAAQTPVALDMSSSSSLTSRAIEAAPEIHAPDRLAPLQAPGESMHPSPHLQEISIRVAGPEQNSASIRMVQSAGEIRIAVRASDPQLADSLRGNVEQLTSRLNNNGMSAEVWKPNAVPAAARAQSPSQDMPQERQGSSAQQWRGSTSRDQQNDKQKRPAWAQEFELWT
jgi:hypothetical protein